MYTSFNDLALLNAYTPKVFTDSGMLIDAKPVPANAYLSIAVTLSGISIEVYFEHWLNVYSPIFVKLLGNLTDVNLLIP